MAQHGAYVLLLRHIYTTEQQIPDKQRHSIAGALIENDQSDVDTVLEQFFKLKNGFWVSDKTVEVIKQTNDCHEKRVNAGKRVARPSLAMPEQCQSNPLANPQ
jgi:uncharacterized protein YdaU (DUF1376 family)